MKPIYRSLLTSLFLLRASLSTDAARSNRSIDDLYGDSASHLRPSYSPSNLWANGEICTSCKAYASITQGTGPVTNNTWHDGTYHPDGPALEIVLNFTGSAVYVYNMILDQGPSDVTILTNLTFFMDNIDVGNFYRAPKGIDHVLYRVPVYVNTTLLHEPHSLRIRADGPHASLILFDSADYTVEESSPTSPSTHTSAVPPQNPPLPSIPQETSLSPTDFPSLPPSPLSSSIAPFSPSTSASMVHERVNVGLAVGSTVSAVVALISGVLAVFIIRRRRIRSREANSRMAASGTSFLIDGYPRPHSSASVPRTNETPSLVPPQADRVTLTPTSTRSELSTDFLMVRAPDTRRTPVRLSPAPSPPSHSVDVPGPAITTTASTTERMVRIVQLDNDLRPLEHLLQVYQHRLVGEDATGSDHDAEEGDRRGHGYGDEKLAALRLEVVSLRRQIEYELRLLSEVAPRQHPRR
ncbi:hypothetical protein C8Q74DRAFT_421328 [Fomes fomentarius]|nr:hypothetical protein C8Q74DRAFT_421328 [Fomes fomentarius]